MNDDGNDDNSDDDGRDKGDHSHDKGDEEKEEEEEEDVNGDGYLWPFCSLVATATTPSLPALAGWLAGWLAIRAVCVCTAVFARPLSRSGGGTPHRFHWPRHIPAEPVNPPQKGEKGTSHIAKQEDD